MEEFYDRPGKFLGILKGNFQVSKMPIGCI